jgi:hypothetical protein
VLALKLLTVKESFMYINQKIEKQIKELESLRSEFGRFVSDEANVKYIKEVIQVKLDNLYAQVNVAPLAVVMGAPEPVIEEPVSIVPPVEEVVEQPIQEQKVVIEQPEESEPKEEQAEGN